jgi:choline dehydrogenase-like flavoprotein
MLNSVVVGSGPAGMAAALALLDRGISVRMVDVGLRLEDERQQVIRRLAEMPPDRWDPEDAAFLRGGADVDANGIGLKRLFGSVFPYRGARESLKLVVPEKSLTPSFALGGLSNIWGAAVLPYSDRDLAGWPIGAGDLAPHYRKLGAYMPVSAAADPLTADYPICVDRPQPPLPSRQATRVLSHLERHRDRLQRRGMRFGYARIAMQTSECRKCGMCLLGCPYDLIFNTRQTLDRIGSGPRFTYLSGLVVRTVEERRDQVVIKAEDAKTGALRELRADRCFLAAGVIATTRIVLESLGWVERPVSLINSQHGTLPLLALRATSGVEREPLHTLCQIFLEVDDQELSHYNIHCQIYTYNNLYEASLRKTPWGRFARLPGIRGWLLGRLMVALCYIHSDDSGRIQVRLERRGGERLGALVADIEESQRADRVMRGLAWKLLRHAPELGFAAVAPAVHIANPGWGHHTGGAFPMIARPVDGQTDLAGRLLAWRRIHLVDASVFPTIPSATITYSVMANAHRIATAAADL